jgi:hypothetical protein
MPKFDAPFYKTKITHPNRPTDVPYQTGSSMALDFATGLFPTDFCVFLRKFAQTNEGVVRRFITWFRRFCSRALWWPIWSAVSCPDNDTNVSNTSGDADGENENGAGDVTGYCSATDESGSENSDEDCVDDTRSSSSEG